MFTVNPAPISEVEAYLKPYSAKLQDIWRLLPATAGGTTPKKQRPFVQLAAHEIPEEQEEEVFDYAGISFASNPIGLPLNIEPRTFGDDPRQRIVLFSLDGFYSHLKQIAPELIASVEKMGFDEFLGMRGDEITGREYLCAGLANCVAYRKRETEALTIQW